MKLLYFFDDKIKPITMRGKYYCKLEDTKVLWAGISSIREYDVNLWLYTKNGKTIAFDSGHINYENVKQEFEKIGINPENIRHLFLTHLDTDHAGGIDKSGNNIFRNAHVYMGVDEEKYMSKEIRRKAIFHNCVNIEDGGYAFFDFFTQDPRKNKESLVKLRDILKDYKIKYVCTGHSGIHTYSEKIFAHIDQSATFGKKAPFHKDGEYNPFKEQRGVDYRNWVPASLLRNVICGSVIIFILSRGFF